jgi:two-component system, LytTR family, response regulator
MLRTDNPLERLMKEIRGRTQVAEQFPHEENAFVQPGRPSRPVPSPTRGKATSTGEAVGARPLSPLAGERAGVSGGELPEHRERQDRSPASHFLHTFRIIPAQRCYTSSTHPAGVECIVSMANPALEPLTIPRGQADQAVAVSNTSFTTPTMPEVLRVLIVDDEPVARELLSSMLSAVGAVEVVGECRNAHEAIAAIREEDPDAVFLDVEMPGDDGFSVTEAIGVQQMPATVFISAYDHHAVKAFEVLAADYLLKPFDERRLEITLDRITGRLQDSSDRMESRILRVLEELPGMRRYTNRLPIEVGDHLRFLSTAEIIWIEAKGKHSLVHTDETTYVLREGLADVAARLDPTEFLRVHRSSIVRIDQIQQVHRWFRGDYNLVLADGTRLTSGTTYRRAIQQLLLGG